MMRYVPLTLLILSLGCRSTPPSTADMPVSFEVSDPVASKELLGRKPFAEELFGGMEWSEGPLVLPSGEVLCSDIPNNRIMAWSEGESRVWLSNAGGSATDYSNEPGSNGLLLNAAGELLLCQHGSRRVAKMDAPLASPEAIYITVADRYQGKRFNSPNDLVIARDGSILFTDPPYGLPRGDTGELGYHGVFRVDPRGGVTLLTREYSRPNGIGLSPDEKTLYIANSDPKRAIVTATPIGRDFKLGEAKILIDATDRVGREPGLPDGMAVARDGTVFATAPGGVWVLGAEGELIAKMKSTGPVSNVALSPAEDWLYLTNDDRLLRVKLQ